MNNNCLNQAIPTCVFAEGHEIEPRDPGHVHQVSYILFKCSAAIKSGVQHAVGAATACCNLPTEASCAAAAARLCRYCVGTVYCVGTIRALAGSLTSDDCVEFQINVARPRPAVRS